MKSTLTPDALQSMFKGAIKLDKEYNSDVWAFFKGLGSQINAELTARVAEAKAEAKKDKKADGAEYPDDFQGFTPEQRSEEVAKLLDYKLFTKELTASELRELKDIFNLKAKDQDIHIEQVDFRAVEPELADIVAAVNWQITEYNKERSD